MRRAKIVPSAIVLAFALSSCAGNEITAPVEAPVVDAGPADIGGAVILAQTQREAGDLVAATATLSQLVLIAPDDPRVLAEYGKTLIDKGEINDALAFLQRAIELDGLSWTYHSAQGVAFSQSRDYRSASIAFSRALALSPDQPAVLNNFALSQMQAGNLEQAEMLLVRATANGAASPRIAQNLAMVRELRAAQAPLPPAESAPAQVPSQMAQADLAVEVAAVAAPPMPAPAPVEMASMAPVPDSAPQTLSEDSPASVPAGAPRVIAPAEATGNAVLASAPQISPEGASESAILSVEEADAATIWLPATGPIYLQVGSFSSAENAGRFAEQLAELKPNVTLFHAGERELHRVSVGPYADQGEAQLALASLELLGVHDVQAIRGLGEGAPESPAVAEPAPVESDETAPTLRFSENR